MDIDLLTHMEQWVKIDDVYEEVAYSQDIIYSYPVSYPFSPMNVNR
jgi:hypothetical protein